ncbi:methyl-accepting chemotaxis protein [Paenibacillus gorillae]|uniref:methyl-accepting chemotaxis protein n=1 Tax=Paenibacillus gorillae TaxID=1243662 RepID=UPI0006946059|nr:methyl-accepting chemotaxis protein [Paenibacillus gorillae]
MRFNLRWRLALIGVLPLFFYVFSGLYLLGELEKTNTKMSQDVYEVSNRTTTLVLNADRDLYQALSAYQYLTEDEISSADKEKWDKDLELNIKEAKERLAAAKGIMETNGLMELTDERTGLSIANIADKFSVDFTAWSESIMKAAKSDYDRAADLKLREQFTQTRMGLDAIGNVLNQYAEDQINSSKQQFKGTQIGNLAGMGFVSIVLVLLIFFSIRTVMRTVNTVMRKTQMVTDGDLTAETSLKYNKDELGDISRSVDRMIEVMKQLITGIGSNAQDVSTSSQQLNAVSKESAAASHHVAANIQEVANGTEVQARSAEETAKAIEEMTIGIQRIAENTTTAAEQSKSTSEEAGQGQEALERLVEQMGMVKKVIGQLSDVIGHLQIRSQQIGSIAENITVFANQTNILSLNASIEAARAGEQGRGFAVVAGEIRKLAANSLESADGIHQLVAETRSDISGASDYMSQTLTEVDRGNERVTELQQSLTVIVAAIDSMTEQLQENSAITQQMSASSEEVNASMEQSASSAASNLERTESVAAATEEQLALMDNIASAAVHLDEIVGELNRAIHHFKVK